MRDFLAHLPTAQGRLRQCRLAAEVIMLTGVPHALILGEDVTEQLAVEAEMAAATAAQQAVHARLQQVHTMQAEWVRTMSHQFRTPLTAVLGFAALLQSEEYPAAQVRDYARTIHAEARRLGLLITRLLAADQPDTPPGAQLLLDVNALLAAVAQEVGSTGLHPITLDLAPGLPPVAGDAVHLREAVGHLLDNAIAYSPAGQPVVLRSALTAGQVRIEIQDAGAGIPPEALDLVFERYVRLPGPITERRSGLGLGLPRVRDIVRQHGGQVWAERPAAGGTRLICTMPPAAPTSASPTSSHPPQTAV